MIRRWRGALTVIGACALVELAPAAGPPLPVPCVQGCGAAGSSSWLGSGTASFNSAGNQLTITQSSPDVTLYWQSFNIAHGNTVNFVQPNAASIALNRISQANPLQIFGALNANGIVYLLNQNGIVFGSGAQVNVGGLVASTLDMSPAALSNGIAAALSTGAPAFQPYSVNGVAQLSGDITVQAGATLDSPSGQILLFAPNVTNSGLIQTPDGQTILGAGQRIFLESSSNSNLRGLLIEVGDTSGTPTATNLGQIIAERGNVTLAGLAVNQSGLVSATTTVRENGSIVLEAQSFSQPVASSAGELPNDQNGTVTVGAGSTTEVTLEGSPTDVTAAVNAQPQSSITLAGSTVNLLSNSLISAQSGTVSLSAQALGGAAATATAGRIYMAPSSTIDVSGATADLPMSDNTLTVHLTSTELGNLPVQENSPLRGQNVTVDLRDYGTNANGSVWVGTPIADLSGDIEAIQSDVFQRSLTGGSITLNASGAVLISQGATLNVSGGQIDWQPGYINPSVLMNQYGQAVPIASANPEQVYLGTLNTVTTGDPRWGVSNNAALPGLSAQGEYEAGYVQGANAGAVAIAAPFVALDGAIKGTTVTGPLQRLPNTPVLGLTPTFNQVPLGATLTLGNPGGISDPTQTEILGSVTFAAGTVLNTLSGASGAPFDPLSDPLPAGLTTQIRPDLLGPNGVTQLGVYSTGEITLPAGVTLAPGAGGSVTLAAGLVDVEGTIRAPSGAITLEAVPTSLYQPQSILPLPELELGASAVLSATGGWVNDNPMFGVPATPLYTAGGKIAVSSQAGSLLIDAGALLDVTAGAQETAAGQIVAGKGGSISITSTPGNALNDPRFATVFDPTLRGFALANGAGLSISLPSICVSSAACVTSGATRIDPSLLTQDGFGSVSLKTNVSDLTIASDVDLSIHQQNLQLTSAALLAPSGAPITTISQIVTLPVYERKPENLSLSTTAGLPSYADLTIEQGAQLSFDPQASITLSTDSRIIDNGQIRSADGNVSLAENGGGQVSGPDQGLWLGPGASIDVSGTLISTPNQLGLNTGNLFPGGSISLNVAQGFLYLLPGSSLSAAGAAATLDLPVGVSVGSGYVHEQDVTAGGSIALAAAAGLFVGGSIQAPAGAVGEAPGGSLSLSLSGEVFPGSALAPASLEITSASNVPTVAEGAVAPTGLYSQGIVPAALINDGGFDAVSITTRNLQTSAGGQNATQGIGSLVIDPGVTLSPAVSLTLMDPEIRTLGPGTVTLSSAYVALGSNDISSQAISASLIGGGATLNVEGEFIDLIGNSDVQGFNQVNLDSSGDIRAFGLEVGNALPLGSFSVPGNLKLTAQQIYPSTLSSFTIAATGANSTLTLASAPGTPGAVLSAGGSLTLSAPAIVDGGIVRAPSGSINLTGPFTSKGAATAATTIELLSGSVLSVSTSGETVPFGETQAGLSWVYPLTSQNTLVYGTGSGAQPLPQKQISFDAQQLTFNSGATVDIRGGGDLQAFEYTPENANSQDALSPSVSPNTFAVLPSANLTFAPYDPLLYQGSTYAANHSVYLSGGDGLPAGTYVLLPARYALLPGAYLVTEVSGYANIAPGQQFQQLDGSVIVSGRLLDSGTTLGQTLTSGFDIIKPTSYADVASSYTTSSANSFFAQQASAAGQVSAPLPQDAGRVSIEVTDSLALNGTLEATPASGGRGGELDLAANNLIVTAGAATAPAGAVDVSAQQVDQLGVTTLVLGGAQQIGAGEANLSTTASTVTVQGATLSAPEVLLLATGQIDLANGAQLQASGAASGATAPLSLSTAGAAIVGVSVQAQTLLPGATACPALGCGSITVASGASVSAPGAVIIASNNSVDFEGALSARGAAVTLDSNQIAVGNVPAGTGGFVLSASELSSLNGADLLLRSTSALDVYGAVNLNVAQLVLDAPGLNGMSSGGGTPDASLSVNAALATLQNTSSGASVTPATGSGALSITADRIAFGSGTFELGGFAQSTLSAAQDLSVTGTGQLQIGGGLTLNAGVFQGTGAYTYQVTASGAVTTASPKAVSATALASPGAAFGLEGSSLSVGGNFAFTAGALSFTADTGSLEVLPGAQLNVAGQGELFAGQLESSSGGSMALQSTSGSVLVDAGSILDVSAGTGSASGGALSLSAPSGTAVLDGTVYGKGGAGQGGASLSVDAQSLDFGDLVAVAASSGMTGGLTVHERGPGDLTLASGSAINAAAVDLTADQGSIEIAGTINAGTANGGAITLNAQNDIRIDGSLIATATDNAARGGTVQLTSASGGVYLDAGSLVNAGGVGSAGIAVNDTGILWITASRSTVNSVLNAAPGTQQLVLAGTVSGVGQLIVEGNQAYQTNGTLSASDVTASASNPYYQDAATFMANAGAITSALGQASNAAFQLLPGVELDTIGDLNIANTFDLSTWRFNGAPGVLTLRATGNVLVNASITDGFATGSYALSSTPGPSWSYRITAGADLSSADPMGLAPAASLPATGASVVLAAGQPAIPFVGVQGPTVIRTGTGSIQIAAAQDLVLGNQASVIYTAGEAGPGYVLQDPSSSDGLNGLAYPVNGGSISIQVGRNVIGAANGQPSNELFTDWLWRTGQTSTSDFGYQPTAWTVNFGSFEQGIGALGGGDLTIIAGGNIVDLGANVPSVGAPLTATSAPTVMNAGLLTVQAGGSILGGDFLDMAGTASIQAGNSIGQGSFQPLAGRGLYPVLGLANSQFNVTSRSDMTIETVVNPTLVEQSTFQNAGEPDFYSTYGPLSRVSFTSNGGNITLVDQSGPGLPASALQNATPNLIYNPGDDVTLRVFPPTLDALALGGSINLEGAIDLWPAPDGNLNLLAKNTIAFQSPSGAGSVQLVMSAADPTASLPTPETPAEFTGPLDLLDTVTAPGFTPQYYASQPLHGGAYSPNGLPDTTPARIVALTGDITMQSADVVDESALFIPKPVDIYAGGNIVDLGINLEQFSAANVSTIAAGGSIEYPLGRDTFGQIIATNRAINLSGPGQLVIDAGGDINLGTSGGITTEGNLFDPALPSGGASITMTAGVSPSMEYQNFISQYLAPGSSYEPALVSYVETVTGQSNLSAASALSLFEGFNSAEQQPLLSDILIDELRAGGRAAAPLGPMHDNFTQAFDALTGLYPGSNPALSAGQTDPYTGDILLYFSRVYTVQGGDINLIAPGGQINVGLATEPSAFGVKKSPDELGIVAQSTGSVSGVAYGNVSVNLSRVFAADGGNILLWSTEGNIDAGRGAKSAISAPPPTITINTSGVPTVSFPPALTGSGIQALSTTTGVPPGDVDLFAPHGVVNANEAGIVAGNLTIAATAVLGTNNISVSGTSVGVPVPVTGQGLSAAAAGSSTAAATNAGVGNFAEAANQAQSTTPLSEAALAFLDVFVIGLGEEQCAPTDVDCLKRQPRPPTP